MLRTCAVLESLIPAVLEQKVTGTEAHRTFHGLVRRYGEPAPGPRELGLRVFPAPATLAGFWGGGGGGVIWLHALKNALIPVITFAGIYFAILVTTAIVVETVFAWPGLGRLAYEGISSRDFPVIQAVVLTTAAIVAVINLCVDCLYALIDPRIRYAR